jgi:hypothetical protein
MYTRIGTVALTVCVLLVAAPGAGAQEPAGMTQVVPVSGKAKNGRALSGTYAIDRFRSSGNRLVAVGTLRGRLRGRRVVERRVRMPVRASRAPLASQVPPIPGACQVLNLALGPINLDLLGLVVRTNRINLRIDAVPGAGNLLGNLLCAITGLLDPQVAGARQTAPALNALLALVPRR